MAALFGTAEGNCYRKKIAQLVGEDYGSDNSSWCKIDSGVSMSSDMSLSDHFGATSLTSSVTRDTVQQAVQQRCNSDVCDSAVFLSNPVDNESNLLTLDRCDAQLLGSDSSFYAVNGLNSSTLCSDSAIPPVFDRPSFLPLVCCLEKMFHPDEDGDTMLHLAIVKPEVSAAMWLIVAAATLQRSLSCKCLLNIQNHRFHHTPLHLAVFTNQPQLVRALLVCGADQQLRDQLGCTPMHLACSLGHTSCIAALTQPISQQEQHELIRYCHGVHLPTFRPLPISLPDFSCLDYEGRSHVHLVLISKQSNRLQILNQLLSLHSPLLNIQDGKTGQTVLHLAVKQNDMELVQYLLSRGAELHINATDYSRLTALDVAHRLEFNDIAELLSCCGARFSNDVCSFTGDDSSNEDTVEDSDDLTVRGRRHLGVS